MFMVELHKLETIMYFLQFCVILRLYIYLTLRYVKSMKLLSAMHMAQIKSRWLISQEPSLKFLFDQKWIETLACWLCKLIENTFHKWGCLLNSKLSESVISSIHPAPPTPSSWHHPLHLVISWLLLTHIIPLPSAKAHHVPVSDTHVRPQRH